MSRTKQRVMLLVLIALFVFPVLASFGLFHFTPNWRPWGTSNKGELIVPIRALPQADLTLANGVLETSLRSMWTILVVVEDGCDSTCTERLTELRQVRKALNKDAGRIQRLLVSTTSPWSAETVKRLSDQFPDLVIGLAPPTWIKAFTAGGTSPSGGVYLIDPRDNLMMSYGDAQPSTDIYDDLHRLLKSSRAG